jgi:fatty acid desaturase
VPRDIKRRALRAAVRFLLLAAALYVFGTLTQALVDRPLVAGALICAALIAAALYLVHHARKEHP